MISLLVTSIALAADLPGEEIYTAPAKKSSSQPTPRLEMDAVVDDPVQKTKHSIKKTTHGNLPREYLTHLGRESTESELIVPPKGSIELFRAIRVGDSIELSIQHSVIAFPDEKSPVIALGLTGSMRGIKFIGESFLEVNTKRIFIHFNRIAVGDQIYAFKGVGLSIAGQPGLTGEYHSNESTYFAGDFVSSFVAGYFDGLVPRHTNAFGQVQADTSIDSAVKKGLASGALSTAERFKEKLKKVPEFSEIKGPFQLRALILEQAKSTK
ncbi:MAG: hypothetical protein AB7O96_09065 [Pseudobdellovibrionaceae bacterium]